MQVLNWLKSTMETPTAWGWFHTMMFIITVVTTILFCIFFRNVNDKKFRKIIFVCWIVFLVFELYKELTFVTSWEFDSNGKLLSTSYDWSLFPFQFCSTPFYILPFIVFLPEGKVRDAFMAYTSTFVLFAGFIVMILPGDVFVPQIGIDIQTMVHHGLQVILGIYVTVYNRNKYRNGFKNLVNYYWPGLIVFACMAVIAIALNETMHAINPDQAFNMFFISRYQRCTLILLSDLWDNGLRGIPFTLLYLVGFSIIAAIFTAIEWGAIKLVDVFTKQKTSTKKNA